MKACGIIAEYNPFHNGHLYQLSEAKKRSGADLIIVVMSGNFLQRGEPALVDKWRRAEMAIAGGADLVVELPVAYSVQPADIFARGAVQILKALDCTVLSFGAESGTGDEFKEAAKMLLDHSEQIDTVFKEATPKSQPYAARMETAVNQVLPNFSLDVNRPNNQLGIAYAKENARSDQFLDLEVITRVQAEYLDQSLNSQGTIASATAIRKALLCEQPVPHEAFSYVPDRTAQLLSNRSYMYWEKYWNLLKYQILTSSIEELRTIYQMEEGLEFLLKKAIQSAKTFEGFIEAIKSKRMTRTRLQRLCTYVLLNLKKEDILEAHSNPATRILGFSSVGQQYLGKIKDQSGVHLLTKIDKKTKKYWRLDIKAGNVYQLADQMGDQQQDFARIPVKDIDIKLHP